MKEKLVLICQWKDIFPQNGNDIAWAKVTQSDAAATEVKDRLNKRTKQEMGQAKRVRKTCVPVTMSMCYIVLILEE